ncbi:MAG: hypothetical protein R2807_08015 [Chitinophagales bacterium]
MLHPMGLMHLVLPAEQYAIQTGQHHLITTHKKYRNLYSTIKKISFLMIGPTSNTCEPAYYKHTQWIFLQLFQSWYNKETEKAASIESLIANFETNGNLAVKAACDDAVISFTADEWKSFSL